MYVSDQPTTDEVVSVIQALRDLGYSLDDVAMYGDSAGGGLVAASVLKMRDEGQYLRKRKSSSIVHRSEGL